MNSIKVLSGQKVLPTLLIIAIFFSLSSFAEESFSIYLVRHAEKQQDEKNPSLTDCGLFRAKQLASLLSQAEISSIYSTAYQRTMQTAQPLATLKSLAIKNYNPQHLDQFSLRLIRNKENALVVGHSNTTPMLTALLSEIKVDSLTEDDYQFLYQIQFIGEQKVLTLFKQPLICKS